MRWLSRDPLGESGGLNLDAYCRNDPINKIDPLGLDAVEVSDSGEVFWVIEKDGLRNKETRRISLGVVNLRQGFLGVGTKMTDGEVMLGADFGRRTVPLSDLKDAAALFWKRPLEGSVMNPRDLTAVGELPDLQDSVVRDYLDDIFGPGANPSVPVKDRLAFTRRKVRLLDGGVSALGVAGNGGGMAVAYTLITIPEGWTTALGVVMAIRSTYGLGANSMNLGCALTDQDSVSTGSLLCDVGQAVAPGNRNVQFAATAVDFGFDLCIGGVGRNLAQSSLGARNAAGLPRLFTVDPLDLGKGMGVVYGADAAKATGIAVEHVVENVWGEGE